MLLGGVVLGLAALVAVEVLAGPGAPTAPPREYEVKASFLYNFALFTRWPDEALAGGSLRVCVLGDDPFGAALDGLSGMEAQGKPVAVARPASASEARNCHILFISRSEESQLPAILLALGSRSVLTIGDSHGLAQRGLVVSLFLVEGRVAFEVNARAARSARLEISSKVLRLANAVY